MAAKLPIIHPGEVLEEEFLAPLAVTRYRLAKATGLAPTRVGQICAGRRAITAETALRFSRFFGNSPQFWMNLQAEYDLRVASRIHQRQVEREVTPLLPARA